MAVVAMRLALVLFVFHTSFASFVQDFQSHHLRSNSIGMLNGYRYKTLYLAQNVDHFGFEDKRSFQQRYLLADQFWNNDGGPIFFYTGSEGDITWLCNNTGFLWDSTLEFKALLVFAEHRYYGESLPFGSDSFANASVQNYLTVEQAMADYAILIQHLKQTVPGAAQSPVIAVGGFYGGMLAAWMRLKYPNLVLGALASSAPVWQFSGLAGCGSYYRIVQKAFQTHGSQQCVDNIADAWSTFTNYWPGNLDFLSKAFSFCKPIEDKYALSDMLDWVAHVIGKIAMMNYPYPADFLQPLPASPVKEFCQPLSEPLHDDNLTLAMAQGVKMYFNHSGQASCIDMAHTASANLGDTGWSYQTCTEMVMPICSNNSEIIFNIDWDIDYLAANCKYQWGVTPRADWIPLQFWGNKIKSASNIIFSNGMMDPWSGGGVLETLSPSLVAIQIPSAAHRLDLQAKHSADPADVTAAREQEKNIIKTWIYGAGH